MYGPPPSGHQPEHILMQSPTPVSARHAPTRRIGPSHPRHRQDVDAKKPPPPIKSPHQVPPSSPPSTTPKPPSTPPLQISPAQAPRSHIHHQPVKAPTANSLQPAHTKSPHAPTRLGTLPLLHPPAKQPRVGLDSFLCSPPPSRSPFCLVLHQSPGRPTPQPSRTSLRGPHQVLPASHSFQPFQKESISVLRIDITLLLTRQPGPRRGESVTPGSPRHHPGPRRPHVRPPPPVPPFPSPTGTAAWLQGPPRSLHLSPPPSGPSPSPSPVGKTSLCHQKTTPRHTHEDKQTRKGPRRPCLILVFNDCLASNYPSLYHPSPPLKTVVKLRNQQ